jgi:hypothetical protein
MTKEVLMAIQFKDLKKKYPEAARAFVEEHGRRVTPFVAFLDSEGQLRAIWEGDVEIMVSTYQDSKWTEPEDVWGDIFTPEIEGALNEMHGWS